MRVERRQGPRRVKFSNPLRARLMAIDGTWCRNCLLIDASDNGAQLELEGAMTAAKEFFLMLSFTSQPAFRRCKTVWINGSQLGVTFEQQRTADPETRRRVPARDGEAV